MNSIKTFFFNKNSLIIVFFTFLLTEIATKFLQFSYVENFRVGVVVKVLFVIIYIGFILTNYKTVNKRVFYFVSVLGLYYLIINGLLEYNFYQIKKNLLFLSKYLFIFIVFDWYQYFTKAQKNKLFKIIENFIIINSVIIIIATLFEISIFKTYIGHLRFGYNGLMYMNSQSSFIYIFFMGVLIAKYLNTRTFKLKYILIPIAAILTGTKAIIIFLLLMFIFLFFKLKIYKNKYFYILPLLIASTWSKFIAPILVRKFEVLVSLYHKSGLLTMLLSRRDELLHEILTQMNDKINILFGGFPFYELRAELGIIDVFLFFGLLGGIYYLYNYYDLIIKDLIRFNNSYVYYFLSVVFIILFFSGNYFTNAVTAIYIIASIDKLKQLAHQ